MLNFTDKLHEKLDDLLETSDIPWWEWDIKKNLVRFNSLKVTLLGYSPQDFKNADYQAFTSLLHPDDYERTMDAMRDYLSGKAPVYQVDYRIRDITGNYHWYLDRGAAVEKDENGAPSVLRGIVLDMGYYFTPPVFESRLIELFRRSKKTAFNMKQGFVVICSSCRKVNVAEDEWSIIEEKFTEDAGMYISHSICNDCVKLLYPDLSDKILAG